MLQLVRSIKGIFPQEAPACSSESGSVCENSPLMSDTCYPHWDVGLVQSGGGQTDGREDVHVDLRLEFQQGDVVVKRVIIKSSMKVFLCDINDFPEVRLPLETDIVLPHYHLDFLDVLPLDTVGSCDDPGAGDERSSTVECSVPAASFLY